MASKKGSKQTVSHPVSDEQLKELLSRLGIKTKGSGPINRKNAVKAAKKRMTEEKERAQEAKTRIKTARVISRFAKRDEPLDEEELALLTATIEGTIEEEELDGFEFEEVE